MSRWRLHRGGVVNIWQYTEQTFDFSGGRAIFQGTNGSGKSRTLELLLPLCLDGDLRQLGSKGFDTVSIRRLMLDDYDGGPNRIGYAWVELIREADDHSGNEYLTCGIGVKASKTSQAITDSWRFVTPAAGRHRAAARGPGPASRTARRSCVTPSARTACSRSPRSARRSPRPSTACPPRATPTCCTSSGRCATRTSA